MAIITLEQFIKDNNIKEGFSATRVLDDGREQSGLLFKDNNGRDIFAIYGANLQDEFGPIDEIWHTCKDRIRFVHSRIQSNENGNEDKWRITFYKAKKKQRTETEIGKPEKNEEENAVPFVDEQEKKDQTIPTQENKTLNKDYIGALRERNGLLEYFEFPIPQYYEILLDELRSLKEDDSKALPTLESRFIKDFPDTTFSEFLFSYVYPHDYGVSGINMLKYYHMHPQITIEYPHLFSNNYSIIMKEYEVNDMAEFIQTHINQLETSSDQKIKFDKIMRDKNDDKITDDEYKSSIYSFFSNFGDNIHVSEETKKQYMAEQNRKHNKDLKTSFFIDVKKFVRAYQYQIIEQTITKLSDVKMYSTDQCGWKKFNYPIDDNITISIDTNFGFGSSSYFICILKYKGIAILPYTAIVDYYYAEMRDMKNCTRRYLPRRNSWCCVFDFVKETANYAKHNLSLFEDTFILSEIKKMIFGLHCIMSNPKNEIDEIKKRIPSERDGYIFVRQFTNEDKELYEILPDEKLITDKIYKISSALAFLENLKELSSILPTVTQYIDEIISMNNSIRPEIHILQAKVIKDIDAWNKKKENNLLEIEKNASLLFSHVKIIKKQYEETYKMPVTFDEIRLLDLFSKDTVFQYEWKGHLALSAIEKKYQNEVPAYNILMKRRKTLFKENDKIKRHIQLRTKLIDVLQDSLQRIESIVNVA